MIFISIIAFLHLISAIAISIYFWKPNRVADLPAMVLITFFSTFYGFPIIIGWSTGYINFWTILISGLIAIILGASSVIKNPHPCLNLKTISETIKRMPIGEKLLWVIIVCLTLIIFFLGSLLPIRTWDAVSYHSLNPMRWAETHRFIIDSYGDPKIDCYVTQGEVFPNVKAILPYMVMDFTGREQGTALAQFPYFVLLISSLIAIYKRLFLPGYAVALAILFCILAPEVLLQSIEAYTDVAFFAGQMAVLFICLLIYQEGISYKRLFLASLSFTILSGTKPTALLMCGALGIIFLIIVFFKTQDLKFTHRLYWTFGALFCVLLICSLIAGPWYLHGIKKFSNPIYPYEFKIGKKVIFSGPSPSDTTSKMVKFYQKATGLKAWWRMMNEAYRLPIISSWEGGFGAHTIILGVPATLIFLSLFLKDRKREYYSVALSLFAVMYIFTPVRLCARFILFLLALFGLGFGWLISETLLFPRIILLIFFAITSLYNIGRVIPAILYRTFPPEIVAFSILTGHTRGVQTGSFPDQFNSLDYWREHIACPGAVLAVTNTPPYLARPLKEGAKVVRVFEYKKDSPIVDWVKSLRDVGATHLYAPRDSLEFDIAMKNPQFFRLLMHRIDGGSETTIELLLREESALFEISPELRKGNLW